MSERRNWIDSHLWGIFHGHDLIKTSFSDGSKPIHFKDLVKNRKKIFPVQSPGRVDGNRAVYTRQDNVVDSQDVRHGNNDFVQIGIIKIKNDFLPFVSRILFLGSFFRKCLPGGGFAWCRRRSFGPLRIFSVRNRFRIFRFSRIAFFRNLFRFIKASFYIAGRSFYKFESALFIRIYPIVWICRYLRNPFLPGRFLSYCLIDIILRFLSSTTD